MTDREKDNRTLLNYVLKIQFIQVKTKEKQEARSVRVKKMFTMVYMDTHSQVFWDDDATQIVRVHNS